MQETVAEVARAVRMVPAWGRRGQRARSFQDNPLKLLTWWILPKFRDELAGLGCEKCSNIRVLATRWCWETREFKVALVTPPHGIVVLEFHP